MRERIVKRFYCDFCKKSGGQKAAMAKHEKYCTLNPNRDCRMCGLITGGHPEPMAELLAILPDMPEYPSIVSGDESWKRWETCQQIAHEAMAALREKVDNCPACILATIRQKNTDFPVEFDFQAESKAIFAEYPREHGPY